MDILIPLAGLVGSLALSSVLVAGLVDLVYGADGRAERRRRAEERARAELRAHVRGTGQGLCRQAAPKPLPTPGGERYRHLAHVRCNPQRSMIE